jgi:SagB-type dehydrogenase family enzyme
VTPVQVGQATRHYLPYGRTSRAREVDWSVAPGRYKAYPTARRAVLPWPPRRHGSQPADRLSALLWSVSGLTRLRWTHPGDPVTGRRTGGPPSQVTLRPAPSGGALYPVEVYLATGEDPSLPFGLYHYDPAHHCVDLLRDGDHRAALIGLLTLPSGAVPDLILALAPVWWRNAFKYHEFGYRIMCQETGTLVAQTLAVAQPLGLTATVHLRYADEQVNSLLGLETFRESVTALLTLRQSAGRAEDNAREPNRAIERDRDCPGKPPASSRRPTPSYADLLIRPTAAAADPPPAITHLLPVTAALHAASMDPGPPPPPETTDGASHAISLSGDTDPPILLPTAPIPLPAANVDIAAGVPHRTSAPAGFHRRPIGCDALATILAAAGDNYPEELRDAVRLYCLALHVEGLSPGVSRYDSRDQVLLPITGAETVEPAIAGIRALMTWLAIREAAVALIPVGDPEAEVARYGDRGYRLLQIATGIATQRAALAAAALGLGARLYSDGTTDAIDTALGLTGSPWSSQTMLLIGTLRTATLDRPILPGW